MDIENPVVNIDGYISYVIREVKKYNLRLIIVFYVRQTRWLECVKCNKRYRQAASGA